MAAAVCLAMNSSLPFLPSPKFSYVGFEIVKIPDVKDYQTRPGYIADLAWRRGYLKPLELLRVAAWKTGQGLGHLTVNTEEDIEDRSDQHERFRDLHLADDRVRP